MTILQTKYIWIFLSLMFMVIFFLSWQLMAYKTEMPNYTIAKKDGNIEIRQYPPMLIAQVEVRGERYSAINNGFRMLADYIFGNNQNKQKIAMTAPVMQQNAAVDLPNQNTNWKIQFVMPTQFTLEKIPKPVNGEITLLQAPAKTYVVIEFSGTNSDENIHYHETILRDYIQKNHLKILSEPVYAFYNPPWILPFLRRNEILIEIGS